MSRGAEPTIRLSVIDRLLDQVGGVEEASATLVSREIAARSFSSALSRARVSAS